MRRTRALVVLYALVANACFSPDIQEGLLCGPNRSCPPGQTCDISRNVCVRDGVMPDAAAAADDANDRTRDAQIDASLCWQFDFTFADTCDLPVGSIADLTLLGFGSPYVYDTDSGVLLDSSGATIAHTSQILDGVRVIVTDAFALPSASVLRAQGSLPLGIAGRNSVFIEGTIDVSANNIDPPPAGANWLGCGSGVGGAGMPDGGGAGGGGGGGYGSSGGSGGNGEKGIGGAAGASALLTTVHGGCAGGDGGIDSGAAAMGGSSGGAVLLISEQMVAIAGTIHAGGAGGAGGFNDSGGAGAGSGGSIIVEAPTVIITAPAVLAANGGGGGGGKKNGAQGQPASAGSDAAAGGLSDSGAGGDGAAGSTAAVAGFPDNTDSGGGGGGGVGIIAVHADSTTVFGTVSPPAIAL